MTLIYLSIILVCLVVSAFFSGSETALLRLNTDEIEKEIRTKNRPSIVAAKELIKSSSRLLVTILVGNNTVNILATALASSLAVSYLGEETGVMTATIAMTVLVLIFSEILPKAIAARSPIKIATIVSLPLYLIHKMLFPAHILFDKLVDPLINKLVGAPKSEDFRASAAILRLARRFQEKQHDGTPLPIIGSVANAGEMTASEIMVPRGNIFAFSIDTDPKTILDRMLEERYTRAPVYEDSLDKVLGVIHLKDIMKLMSSGQVDARSIIKPVLRVPERMPILMILKNMQKAFVHMAIVKDEFDVTQGLLTQEDILEEIVGEIRDEFDLEELLAVRKIDEDTYEALGRLTVHDFNRESGWSMKVPRGDTLGGTVFNNLGRIPKLGDKIQIEGYMIEVEEMSGSRIIRVRVTRLDEKDHAPSEGH